VPVLDVAQDHSKYFDWHHTEGDTADKLDPADLSLATAAFANLTWALASAPELLGRTAPLP
jgi:carboxypeptidase Q